MRVHPSLLETFTDSATLGMFVMAVCVLDYACRRAVDNPLFRKRALHVVASPLPVASAIPVSLAISSSTSMASSSHSQAPPPTRLQHSQPSIAPSLAHTHSVLTWRSASVLPLLASVSLLLFFYLNHSFQLAVSLLLAFLCAISLYSTLYPHLHAAQKACTKSKQFYLVAPVLCFFLTTLVTSQWLVTSSWAYVDALAAALTVFLVSTIRLPNGQSGTLLLILFLLYDIFWVLVYPQIFGSNVMNDVADQRMANPLSAFAGALALKLDLPRISPPIRFEIPSFEVDGAVAVLGLADVAIPSMFGAYCLAFDNLLASSHHIHSGRQKSFNAKEFRFNEHRQADVSLSQLEANDDVGPGAFKGHHHAGLRHVHSPAHTTPADPHSVDGRHGTCSSTRLFQRLHALFHGTRAFIRFRLNTYFGRVVIGYVVALWLAILSCKLTRTSQPALFFIVPGIAVPPMMLASKSGHFTSFWRGSASVGPRSP